MWSAGWSGPSAASERASPAIPGGRPTPSSGTTTIGATTRACKTRRPPASNSGAVKPFRNSVKGSNERSSKRDACFTANPPHNQTNRMNRTLSWIRPPTGPKPLTTDSLRLTGNCWKISRTMGLGLGGGMLPRSLTMVALSFALWLAYGDTARAEKPCPDWGSHQSFFERAGAQDVTRCLAAGWDVEARNKDGLTPLHVAAGYSKDPAVITALVAAGANLEARSKIGLTPLHVAAGLSKDPAVITTLVAAGANLEARNQRGWTPLHYAASFSTNPAVITTLLDLGANLEAREQNGWTPLQHAAGFSTNPAVITALVEAGANLEARATSGLTPLHLAAGGSKVPAVITTLVAAGANLEARSQGGWTPLHVAAIRSKAATVIEALLDAGADPAAQTPDGKLPWDFIKENTALKGTDVYWRLKEARSK